MLAQEQRGEEAVCGGRTVPRGATMDAGVNAYEMKLPARRRS